MPKPRSASPPRRRPRALGEVRPRNVDATKRRLLDAVGAILARDGFSRLGINAVAEEARTDKTLIYRYFGGFGELLEAYAEGASFWPTVEEMAGGPPEALAALSLAERVERVVHSYIAQLRARPLTQEILAWELFERNEVTIRLEAVRERRALALMKAVAVGLVPGADFASAATLFAGAVHYLLIRARQIRVFNGIDLRTDEGWERLAASAQSMLMSALQPQAH